MCVQSKRFSNVSLVRPESDSTHRRSNWRSTLPSSVCSCLCLSSASYVLNRRWQLQSGEVWKLPWAGSWCVRGWEDLTVLGQQWCAQGMPSQDEETRHCSCVERAIHARVQHWHRTLLGRAEGLLQASVTEQDAERPKSKGQTSEGCSETVNQRCQHKLNTHVLSKRHRETQSWCSQYQTWKEAPRLQWPSRQRITYK